MGGRGSAGARGGGKRSAEELERIPLSERKNIPDAEIEAAFGEYQYHATTGQAVFSIYEQGLKPSRGHAGKGVYFAPTGEDALQWTAETSTGGTTLMRVKTSTLYKNYSWGRLDSSESTTEKKIKTKDIEIRTGGGSWMSLPQFAEKRQTSYRMWKASKGR